MSKNYNTLSIRNPREAVALLLATAALAGCGASESGNSNEKVQASGNTTLVTDETKSSTKPKATNVSEENPGGFTDANDSNENLDADPEIHAQNVLQLLRNVPMHGDSIPAMDDTTARELLKQTIEAFGPEQTLPGGVSVEDFGNALDEAYIALDGNNIEPDTEVAEGASVRFDFTEGAAEAAESSK